MTKFSKKKAFILFGIGLLLLCAAEFHLLPMPAYPGAGIITSFLMTMFVWLAYVAVTVGIKNVVKRST